MQTGEAALQSLTFRGEHAVAEVKAHFGRPLEDLRVEVHAEWTQRETDAMDEDAIRAAMRRGAGTTQLFMPPRIVPCEYLLSQTGNYSHTRSWSAADAPAPSVVEEA